MNRDDAIDAIISTGKSRQQAEAFLDILGSALTRRGWADGKILDQSEISERLDTFLGDQEAGE